MRDSGKENKKEKSSASHKIMTVVGSILCVILAPMLVINCTLILRSYMNPEQVPSVGGMLPLIVLTDSMYPQIQSGDLIICRTEEPENIKEGDVIAFFDPAGDGTSVVTHRVVEVTEDEKGAPVWRTKGDANNTEDNTPVPAKNLVGVYRHRIGGAGRVAMFMQTTTGLIICVVIPLVLLIAYDIIRRRIYERNKNKDTEQLLAELEALRREKENGGDI